MAVYVIGHRPVASKIKIGSATDPEARLRILRSPTDRTAIPPDIDRSSLELLHCFGDGDWAMERWLHGEFRKVRDKGEWFRLGSNADEVVRRVSNAVGRFREGQRRFADRSEGPTEQQTLPAEEPAAARADLPVAVAGPTELEIRANERELLAELVEARFRQAANADQREALRAILEIYRPQTWRSGGA